MFNVIEFLHSAPDTGILCVAKYNMGWVVTSVLISIFASYAALVASNRIREINSKLSNLSWLLISAMLFGVGTWAMHFIGMLALRLPCSLSYNPTITIVSMIPSILAGSVIFGFVWRNEVVQLPTSIAGILLGGGIGIMHYTGMSAMRLEGVVRYDPALFALSILVAIALSYFAFFVKNNNIYFKQYFKRQENILIAIILGMAVSGMHYTAMAATYFIKGDASTLPASVFTPDNLAIAVTLTTLFLIFAALSVTSLSRSREMSETNRFRYMLETSPIAVRIAKSYGREVVFSNRRYRELIGVNSDDGADPMSYYAHQEDYEYILKQLEGGKEIFDRLIELDVPGSGIKWVIASYLAISYEGEASVLGWFYDITERTVAETQLRKTETQVSTILNSLDEVLWTASAPDFNLHLVSAATEKLYGISQQAFMDDPELWFKMIHPDDQDRVKQSTSQILKVGKTENEYRIIRSDGQQRWVLDRMHVIYDKNGMPAELVGMAHDVTQRKLGIDALLRSEKRAKRSLEELKHQKFALDKHAIVAVTDVKGRITYANSKFSEISGYSVQELIGQDHAILNSGYHPKGFFKEMYRTVSSGQTWHAEICNRAKDGHLYWVDTTIAPFMGDDGKPQSYISIRTDITQRVLAEERGSYLAFYDSLTALPNRHLLMDRLNQALAASARSNQQGALLFLDLDHFKTINDTLGHEVGDLLLQQVAGRLTNCVREGDSVARLGGDEFIVLLVSLSENTLEAAAQTETIAEKILTELNKPYQFGVHEYRSTLSIGVTLFRGHASGTDELLKQADIAMYQSKREGRNTVRFFDPKMQEVITTRVDLENELHKAIEQQQFQLHYQIQIDSNNQPLGAEALIRWQHPERGMISPFNFIPLAEETGLILPIGQWVLDTACAQLNKWQKDPITQHLVLAVNVSAKQFYQKDFVKQVQAAIQRHNINASQLKLELTESMLADNIQDIIIKMTALSKNGVRFSLDDFGTGYSSLQYLKKLPLNQLKIDQSFVRDLVTDRSDKAIVQTIITMASSLDISVIAEGVETAEQQQLLLDKGCMQYQGFLFSKPVPIDEFEVLLRKSWLPCSVK